MTARGSSLFRAVDRATARDVVLLGAIVLFHFATNLAYIKLDVRTANINELSHVLGPIDFLNNLTDFPDWRAAYHVAFTGYPPAGVLATFAFAVIGRVHDAAQFSQFIPSLVMFAAIYVLGRALFSRAAGLVAAALLAVSPAACEGSRQFLLEWPLAAAGVAAIACVWLSRGYADKRYAYGAGLFVGLAALSKQTFLVFLAGPLAVSLVAWIAALRAGRTDAPTAARRVMGRRPAIVAGAWIAGGALVSWFLYPAATRSGIDAWFAVGGGGGFAYGATFLVGTTLLVAGAGTLATLARGPLANAAGAGLVAVAIASVWYFPKGILNFVTYARQMAMNVETMSPASLAQFYRSYLPDYYIGVVPYRVALVLLPVAAGVCIFRFARADDRPRRALAGAYLAAWTFVPFVAFFFINIRNEMNLVPAVPALAMTQAWILTRLLPEKRADDTPPLWARAARFAGIAAFALAFGACMTFGVLSATFFRSAGGDYRALPIDDSDNAIAGRYFPRVLSEQNYLVPQTRAWQVDAIADHILANTQAEWPRVLSQDSQFNFSWNAFWYVFKLRHSKAIVETQLDDNENILENPREPGHILGFDAIVYRVPWEIVLAGAVDDYRANDQLRRTYEYLAAPPDEFRETYRDPVAFPLPDGTTAMVATRRPGAPVLLVPEAPAPPSPE
ncbi:glycosyltransferase family 39 protein [bacterium]|nr:glycosyltransferase family 39 protein [bacterium]